MLGILIAMVAFGAGPYAGIAPEAVEVLGTPVFLSPEAGWSAPIMDEGGGRVRVFVAHTEEEARRWLAERRVTAERVPVYPFGEEGYGNGHSRLLYREHNVVVVVERPGGGALDLADRLQSALTEYSPWPTTPTLAFDGRIARVDGEWAQVAFRAAPVTDPATFLPKPIRVIPLAPGVAEVGVPPTRLSVTVWDRYGRFAEVEWEAE
ncbi:MAG: hypothetical protein JRI25_00600 [Deltaproteobacteria bacterium]|nr:hypothetical protein [Deltaproteobacteria bacterium]MBW2253076.1 hypothetical protein [Deltaproteobacteria bacterium]